MKLPIVILAVFGLVCGKSLPTRDLQDDLNDFLALLPTDQIVEVALDYLANDQEVQEFVVYIQSDEFHGIVTTVEALDEFKNFVQFIDGLGVNLTQIINTIHDVIGLPPFQPRHSTRRGVGVSGLVDDVLALIPIDKIQALFEEKLQTSPDFRAFVQAVQSPEFQGILNTLRALPEYQNLLDNLRAKGVDVDAIIEFLRSIFGVGSL